MYFVFVLVEELLFKSPGD